MILNINLIQGFYCADQESSVRHFIKSEAEYNVVPALILCPVRRVRPMNVLKCVLQFLKPEIIMFLLKKTVSIKIFMRLKGKQTIH